MKLPEFNANGMKWDQYKQFYQHIGPLSHYWYGGFTAFMTGEAICTVSRADPNERCEYKTIGMRIIGTDDANLPAFYDPDGQPLLKAWLNDSGMQTVLLDLDTHKAISLAGSKWDSEHWPIPNWARGECTAYCPGTGRDWITGATIEVSKADEWDREEWKHVDLMRAGCEAWAGIERVALDLPSTRSQRRFKQVETIVDWSELLKAEDITDLTDGVKRRVAQFGISRRRVVTRVPYISTVEGTPDSLAAAQKLKDGDTASE
jgi:hypothetical protein